MEEENTEKTQDRIALAKEAADKLAAENERMEANIAKLEGLRSEQILSGTTNAGQVQQPKELSNIEYKDYILKHGKPPEQ